MPADVAKLDSTWPDLAREKSEPEPSSKSQFCVKGFGATDICKVSGEIGITILLL